VSGTITAGNVGFKLVSFTGSLGAAGGASSITFPTGATKNNIVMNYGLVASGSTLTYPFQGAGTAWNVTVYFDTAINLYLPSTSTSAAGQLYTLYIMYAP